MLEIPLGSPVYPNQGGTPVTQPERERGVVIVDFRV